MMKLEDGKYYYEDNGKFDERLNNGIYIPF